MGALASPGKRLAAYIVDSILPCIATLIVFSVAAAGAMTDSNVAAGMGVVVSFLLAICYGVVALILFARGTTPGKYVLGMYVMKEDGRRADFLTMLVREWIGKFISGMFLSLGFLWILFDKERQGWHDKLVSTYVVSTGGKVGASAHTSKLKQEPSPSSDAEHVESSADN